MRRAVPVAIASAVVMLSGCHRKQQQVSVPPAVEPQQPRTVAPRQPPRRKPAAARKEPAVTSASRAPDPEPPKLVDFLTDEQRQQYDRDITANLRAAEENLAAFRQRGDAGKAKEADRVESLVKRSRQERDSGDLSTARKLANMAKVVSDTLSSH